jgi:acylphosphatase
MKPGSTDRVERITVDFDGRVQGVGFRFAVCEAAARHPVTGFVRNEHDGSVRVVAEGAPGVLEAFIKDIYRTRVGAHIQRERRHKGPAQGRYTRFRIEYG